MNDTLARLIGDVPVSEQINMALQNHTHDYATHDEIEDLKQKINMLINLVGDKSVSEQICDALQNMK